MAALYSQQKSQALLLSGNRYAKLVHTLQLTLSKAWILNATVRENILFGTPYDEARYWRTVQACQLMNDFRMLPAGDKTEIGEKGINLSGGQKQRVSLARAVYADADLYILDDVLSALGAWYTADEMSPIGCVSTDAHVGKKVFEKVVKGVLAEKTKLLVTHQLQVPTTTKSCLLTAWMQYLPETDWVVVMKNGTIDAQGSYESLLQTNEAFATLISTHVAHMHDDKETQEIVENLEQQSSTTAATTADAKAEEEDAKPLAAAKEGKGQLVKKEERETGHVEWRVYKTYIKAMGGAPLAIAAVIVYTGQEGGRVAGDAWLAYWSKRMYD